MLEKYLLLKVTLPFAYLCAVGVSGTGEEVDPLAERHRGEDFFHARPDGSERAAAAFCPARVVVGSSLKLRLPAKDPVQLRRDGLRRSGLVAVRADGLRFRTRRPLGREGPNSASRVVRAGDVELAQGRRGGFGGKEAASVIQDPLTEAGPRRTVNQQRRSRRLGALFPLINAWSAVPLVDERQRKTHGMLVFCRDQRTRPNQRRQVAHEDRSIVDPDSAVTTQDQRPFEILGYGLSGRSGDQRRGASSARERVDVDSSRLDVRIERRLGVEISLVEGSAEDGRRIVCIRLCLIPPDQAMPVLQPLRG